VIASYTSETCAACSSELSPDARATFRTIERLASAISRARLISRSASLNGLQELDYRKCARCGAICGTGAANVRAISDVEAAAKLAALKRLLAMERRTTVSQRGRIHAPLRSA
jgi:hypothetical protein